MFYLTGRAVSFNQSHDINYCGYCSQIVEGTLMVPHRQTAARALQWVSAVRSAPSETCEKQKVTGQQNH